MLHWPSTSRSAVASLLGFVATRAVCDRETAKKLRGNIRSHIPTIERMHYVMLTTILDGPYTVKDVQHRLGLRRPGLVYKMIFEPTLTARRECYLLDGLQSAMEFHLSVEIVPRDDAFDLGIALYDLEDKLTGVTDGPLTENEHRAMDKLLNDPKQQLLNSIGRTSVEQRRQMKKSPHA